MSEKKYAMDYAKIGAYVVAGVIGAPVWVPLAIIGYCWDKTVEWLIKKQVEYEFKDRDLNTDNT